MADNVTLPGTGGIIASDEVGGAQYQRIKIALGAEGAAADLAPGQAAMAASVPVAIANNQSGVPVTIATAPALVAGEAQVGTVGSPDNIVTVTASLDTNIYADGDVLFDTQEIALAARVNGGTTILQSIVVSDINDQGQGFDLIFFNANTSLGTENSAPDIDDTEVLTVIGRVQVGAGAFYDLVANRVACVTGIGLLMKAGAATTSIYVAGISRGTGTYTAAGLQIQFGFMRN